MTTESGTDTGGSATPGIMPPSIEYGGESFTLDDARALIDQGLVDQKFADSDGSQWTEPTDEAVKPKQARSQEVEREQESPSKEEDAGPEEVTSEDDADDDPGKTPSIEMPKSWAKDDAELWASLTPAAQEKVAAREQERDKALNRNLNEAAEQRKAVEAERAKAEQSRNDYEGKLKGVVQELTEINNSQFSEIKSQADLDKLVTAMNQLTAQGNLADAQHIQNYLMAWNNHQQKLQAKTYELRQIEESTAKETASKWAKFAEEQDGKFSESLSEAERAKLDDRLKSAPDFLENRGFSKQELADLWNGKSQVSLRDHRIQALILDGLKLREIQSAPLKAVPKDVPKVQRPGVQRSQGEVQDESIQALERRLNQTGSEEDAWRLLQAREKRSRRAS